LGPLIFSTLAFSTLVDEAITAPVETESTPEPNEPPESIPEPNDVFEAIEEEEDEEEEEEEDEEEEEEDDDEEEEEEDEDEEEEDDDEEEDDEEEEDEEEEEEGPCDQEFAVRGNCRGLFEHFSYNKDTGKCEKFEYGGCSESKNNFESLAACQEECVDTHVAPCDQEFAVVGTGRALFEHFSYNKDTGKCEKFFYYGGGGNRNNFESLAACQEECGAEPIGPPPVDPIPQDLLSWYSAP